MQTQRLTIGKIAQQAGISTSAIRFYEREGLLPPPDRVGGQRRYDPAIIERLTFIQTVKRYGFTLDEIKSFLEIARTNTLPPLHWRKLAEKKLPEIDAQIQMLQATKQLLMAGSECTCNSITNCFDALQAI